MGKLFNSYIEKMAADIDVEKEKELIKRYQATGDPIALQQLRYRFREAIRKGTQLAGINTPNIPKEALEAAAMKEFKRSVMNYDESHGAKPSSYIIGNISNNLKKLNYEYTNQVRMSSDNTEDSRKLNLVNSFLERQLDRSPTYEEQQTAYNKMFKKNIAISKIQRIDDYTRNELSSDVNLGEDNVGENITYEDVFNIGKKTPEDFIKEQRMKEKIDKARQKLDPFERKLYDEYHGFGDYQGRKAKSIPALALNNNLKDAWQAQKLIKQIDQKMQEELKKL